MDIAALVAWIVTAAGGFYLLATWLVHGGMRQQSGGPTRFPVPLIFGHFALAAAGLVVWIAYVATDSGALAWTAFVLLLPVALLGFTMLARWIPVYRGAGVSTGGTLSPGPGAVSAGDTVPAERHIPVLAVVGHGLLAVTTLVLVLLAAAGSGG